MPLHRDTFLEFMPTDVAVSESKGLLVDVSQYYSGIAVYSGGQEKANRANATPQLHNARCTLPLFVML